MIVVYAENERGQLAPFCYFADWREAVELMPVRGLSWRIGIKGKRLVVTVRIERLRAPIRTEKVA